MQLQLEQNGESSGRGVRNQQEKRISYGNQVDTTTIEDTLNSAQTNLCGTQCELTEMVADKGYDVELILDQLKNQLGVRP